MILQEYKISPTPSTPRQPCLKICFGECLPFFFPTWPNVEILQAVESRNYSYCTIVQKRRRRRGGGQYSLPNPDEMSYWKCRWPFAWRAKQWSWKDVRILVAGTCEYATSHAEGTLQTWLRWRSLTCESPGFPGEPDLTVWILQSEGTFLTVVSQRDMTTSEWPERCNVAGLEDGGTGPHIKKHGQHPKTVSD